jgi:23S rRNA-intervening sequence protein
VKNFTDFDAFERAREFARALKIPLQKGTFSKDPTLVYQMRKSILSIYSNFTEGFERDGNREFAQYVSISKGRLAKFVGSCCMPSISITFLKPNSTNWIRLPSEQLFVSVDSSVT